jgi:hypothetical protein
MQFHYTYIYNLLLLPELYDLRLSLFMYKSCKLGNNAEMCREQ